MKTNINIKKILSGITLITMLSTNLVLTNNVNAGNTKIVFPLKQVSKLEFRYTDFSELKSSQKQNLPILNTKNYSKYIKENGGFNNFTRYYTVLWGASYKYGWDVGYGGHQGTDIASAKGTPVYSIADGVVTNAKKVLGWGNLVTISHTINGKKVFSNYAHMSKFIVKKGQKVNAGTKIGEVGSTGNSTGNHLHFQLDLDTPFHPYYYSRETCPYSYYEITENGVCFDDLASNTIDPLLFFETKGEILKNIRVPDKVLINKTKVNISSSNVNNNLSIWNKTVYIGYGEKIIKEVQTILKQMNLYLGKIDGDYKKIEKVIFDFQVEKKILTKWSDAGAGWFGPKTRTALKKEYDKLKKSGKLNENIKLDNKSIVYSKNVSSSNGIKTNKISRTSLKTRAQIEEEEINNFLKIYEFELNMQKMGDTIRVGSTSKIELKILKKSTKNKRTKKYFKGVTPQDITILTDSSIISPFPTKFSSFNGGVKSRNIILKGLKSGTSNVTIMFGRKIIKTYKIKVYSSNEKIYLNKADIYGKSKVISGKAEKGIALFKDKYNKKLIGVKYSGTYKIKGIGDTKVCIKSGSAKYISNIYNRSCKDGEYKTEITFTYDDAVAGILLFDYKSSGSNAKVEITNTYNNSILASKTLRVLANNGTNIAYNK